MMTPESILHNDKPSNYFDLFKKYRFGELHFKQDEQTGLFAIVAIHSTKLGPALGGCRFRHYATIDEAIIDVLRLAHGMTYKAAIHRLPLGGGKSVIIQPTGPFSRKDLFLSFAKFVHSFDGRYITAEDSGTTVEDMDIIRSFTPYVTGDTSQTFSCKDPSPLTALGVRRGIEAAVKHQFQRSTLEGIHVAIQGIGQVGYPLAKELFLKGAKLTVSDIHPQKATQCRDEFGAHIVSTEEIALAPCDVFAPCALGNAINHANIDKIQAKIIAGSANNQLESPMLALKLKERGILYAPDYVINGGGLIHVAAQYTYKTEREAKEMVENIYQTLLLIFERAKANDLPTNIVADGIAEQYLLPI